MQSEEEKQVRVALEIALFQFGHNYDHALCSRKENNEMIECCRCDGYNPRCKYYIPKQDKR